MLLLVNRAPHSGSIRRPLAVTRVDLELIKCSGEIGFSIDLGDALDHPGLQGIEP